jgi:hypothetical protein
MTYKLQPPFEIYHNGMEIADKGGHLCSADNPEIAKAILAALETNCPRAPWCAPVVDDAPGLAQASTDTAALADALEKADWSGVSIGNKVMLKGAIEILRSVAPAQAPPVKDQAALFRVCQRRR